MPLDACKRGFLEGCRPLICLDGCYLKTKYGGIMLTAVGIDPNDCIYPIALAIVEVESLANWKWFLENLKADLGIENTYPWTLMTDKQKVSNCYSNSYCYLPDVLDLIHFFTMCRASFQHAAKFSLKLSIDSVLDIYTTTSSSTSKVRT
jgi:hypothetical protein